MKKLSPLSLTILEQARDLPAFSPSQIFTWETSRAVMRTCHSLVHAGYLEHIRIGTRGNSSTLCPYREPLFKLKQT